MRSSALWVLVGLVLVLIVVPPIGMGFGIERVYGQLMQEVSGQADAAYEVEGRLDRGWLVSKAQTVVRYRSESDGETYELVLDHDIVHGPIPIGELFFGRSPLRLVAAVVDTRFEADPERLTHFAAALEGQPLLRLLAWLRFDRSASFQLLSPEFALADGRVRSEGIEGHADLDLGAGTTRAQVRFGRFSLAGDPGEIRIDESRLQIEGTPRESGTVITGRLELGAVSMGDATSMSRMESSRLDWSTWVAEGELLEGTADLALGDYRQADPGETSGLRALSGFRVEERLVYSPATGLRDLEFALRFERLLGDRGFDDGELLFAARNLDAEAIQGLRAAMERIDAEGLPEMDANLRKAAAFEEWGPRVLGPAPELALEKLSAETDLGPIRGDFRLGIDAADASMLGNPFMVMALTQADLNLAMPAMVMRELLAERLFCTAPTERVEEVDPETGEVTRKEVAARPPLPPPIMQRLWDGYRVDRGAVQTPETEVDAVLEASRFSCQPIVEKMVANGVLLETRNGLETSVRLQETLPFVNGTPRPELLLGIVPDM